MKYSMTCSCGDTMTVDAASREDAVGQIKMQMTEDEVAKHMLSKHPGDPIPPVSQVHAMIEQGVTESQ